LIAQALKLLVDQVLPPSVVISTPLDPWAKQVVRLGQLMLVNDVWKPLGLSWVQVAPPLVVFSAWSPPTP
jgi:hypothetical protein